MISNIDIRILMMMKVIVAKHRCVDRYKKDKKGIENMMKIQMTDCFYRYK